MRKALAALMLVLATSAVAACQITPGSSGIVYTPKGDNR
jgi:hypothetical protein